MSKVIGLSRAFGTAKHSVANGGTSGDEDQGGIPTTPAEVTRIRGMSYPSVIVVSMQSVTITGALGQKMVSAVDGWNAHGKVPSRTGQSCAAAISAGADWFMMPSDRSDVRISLPDGPQPGASPFKRLERL